MDDRNFLSDNTVLIDDKGNKYTLKSKIGGGGSSILYNAVREDSQRLFVVKECYPRSNEFEFVRKNGVVCSADGDPDAEEYLNLLRANMRRESEIGQTIARYTGRTISSLQDLNIVKIIPGDIDRIIFGEKIYEVTDAHFVLMEQAEGEFAKARGWFLPDLLSECQKPAQKDFPLRNGGLPSPYVAACVIEELLKSLRDIHCAGYIHGDVQDGNFFLMGQNPRIGDIGVGQLLDFGTARKILEDGATEIVTDLFSTPGYKSPEMLSEDGELRLTQATDIYSTGCMMLYLLMGMQFKDDWGESLAEGFPINSLVNTSVIISGGYQLKAANLFEQILTKALKQNPAERYQNADEMLTDILKLKKLVEPPRFLLSPNLSRSPYFVENSRDAEIAALQNDIQNTNPLWIWGIGGIGKTELAMEFARKQIDAGMNAYFVTYRGTMRATILALDFSGYHFEFDGAGDAAESEYRERLNILKEDYKGCLLIVDNFESENVELAALQAEPAYQDIIGLDMHILFTTRSRPNTPALELGTLTEKNALTLFKSIAKIKRGELPIIKKLLREVQFHPMAVELLAHTLDEGWGTISAKELLARLKTENLNSPNLPDVTIKKNQSVNEAKIYEHIRTLFNIFNLDDKYREILCHTTLLPLDGIDAAEFLLSETGVKQNQLKTLEGRGWIRRRRENNRLYIHPLVRSVFKNELKPANADCKDFLSNLWNRLDDKYPPVIELFRQAAELYERAIKDLGDADGANNFHAGFCSIMAGDFARAAIFEDRAVALAEAAADKNLDMARLYNDAGVAYLNLYDVDKGMNYLERAIQILTNDAPEDYNAANIFANVSNIYIDLGDYDKAINLAERAVKIFEKTPPKIKFEQINAYQTLGRAFTFAKNYDAALKNIKIAVKFLEELTPDGSADLAKSYRNLSEIYGLTGDIENALAYASRALKLQEKFLPKNHTEIITSYNLIGEIYRLAGNDAESKKFFDKAARAIKINQERNWKKILAQTLEIIDSGNLDATDFVHHYRNAAENYLNLGDIDNALKYIRAAENKIPQIADSLEISLTYSTFSKIYEAQENFDAAIEYAEKNFSAIAQDDFNNLSTACLRLGNLYWRVKKFSEAIDAYEKSIQFQLKYAYPDYDFIDTAKVSIALTFKDMGRFDEAEKILQEVLTRKSQFYPDSHRTIQQLKNLLAGVRAEKNL